MIDDLFWVSVLNRFAELCQELLVFTFISSLQLLILLK